MEIIFWVFIAIALIGLILLLIMALTGGFLDLGADIGADIDIGDFDADFEPGGGPTALGLPVLLFTVTMTGVIGSILSFAGLAWYITIPVSVGGAVIFAVVAFLIMSKVLTMVTSNAVENVDRLKGAQGIVTIPIAKGTEGQVAFSSKKTGRFTVGATASKDIASDTPVIVTQILGDIVKVKPSTSSGNKKSGEKRRK